MDEITINIKWIYWISILIGNLIGGSVVTGIVIQKYKGILKKFENIILDNKDGTPKIVSMKACKEQVENCGRHRMDRRAEDKESVASELAKLSHKLDEQCKEIAEMRKDIASMPSTILKELRSMGFLK